MVQEKYRERLLKATESTKEKWRKIREEYSKNPKLCKFCKKPLSYKKRKNNFCNHSCCASLTNLGVRRHGYAPLNPNKKCLNCGLGTHRVSNKFCSQKCNNEFDWKIRKEKIERDSSFNFGVCEKSTRNIAKRYLLEKNGNQCSICKFTEWLGEPIPLIIDHIDGNCRNNTLNNFRLVCGNCGMKLPTFAGRNIGNGRRSRREVINGKIYNYN